MADSATSDPQPEAATSLLERWSSWTWLGVMAGIVLLFVLGSLLAPSLVYDGLVGPYIVDPIVNDTGYNPVNTVMLALVLLFLVMWAYAVTRELDIEVDAPLIFATTPWLALGSVYRVLEDSDLFAPFGTRSSCLPDAAGSFLETCLGVLFITPNIFIEFAFLAVLFLVIAHEAWRVARAHGTNRGLAYYGTSLGVLYLLYLAAWIAQPSWVNPAIGVIHPGVVLIAFALLYGTVHWFARARGELSRDLMFFGFGLAVLVPGVLYVIRWMTGDIWRFSPPDETRAWVWLGLILAPTLMVVLARALGRILSNRKDGIAVPVNPDTEPDETAVKPMALMSVLMLATIAAAFITIIALKALWDGTGDGTLSNDPAALALVVLRILVGPLVMGFSWLVALKFVEGGFSVHPSMVHFTDPVNLLMIFGQTADALLTATGIDAFPGVTEKHFVPRTLFELIGNVNLPFGLNDWPTAVTFLPLKLAIVMFVIWVIDVKVEEPRQNLLGLVKLSIVIVGLSPAIRNATRLAMGT